MKQKNLYLMCGAPGAGKSHYLMNLISYAEQDGIIISRDLIRFSLVSEDEPYFSHEDEVFNTYIATIQKYLDNPEGIQNIYCDATQLTESARNKVLDRLNLENVANIYAIVIRPSLEETLRRNAGRTGRTRVPDSAVKRMYNSYTDPANDKKYSIIPIYAEYQEEENKVEKRIFLTSDLHINHDRAFIYAPRGFQSVQEMNEALVQRWNEVVGPDDEVYMLGDAMLGDSESALEYMRQLNGAIHIVLGNHDTDNREKLYYSLPNVVEVALAAKLKYKKHHFFMTHYPCMTGNLEKESLTQCTCNLYGHTHQKTNFYNDIPFMYHVGVDSHNCYPVLLDDIIKEMHEKVEECKSYL